MARSVCPHDCPSVCSLDVEIGADGRLGRVRGHRANPYTAGVVCAKVARYAERLYHPDRLLTPMRRSGPRGQGSFTPIGWDEALDEVAEGLLKAEQRHGREAVWPYWYAGTMGLVNRDGINRLTHGRGWSRFKGTICVSLSDAGWRAGAGRRWGVPATEIASHSELVVIWGGNPVATHVNLMSHVARARKERKAPLVVVDPYRSPTAEQADLHLAPMPGTDGALACAVMHVLFRDGLADRAYMASYTDDPAGLEAHLRSRSPAWAAAITGVAEEQIEAFARLYGSTRRSYLRLGFGFTRSRNGAAAMHAVSCLPAVTGAWQYEGGGALYSQGDLYGLDKTMIEGLELVDAKVRLLDQSRIGDILTGDAEALQGGPPVDALLIQNTNPMAIAPDLGKVHRGFARPDLFIAVHEQFMTDTAKMADILLPATMFLEHDDIYTAGAHARLQVGRKLLEPLGQCRSNHAVLKALAARLGVTHPGFEMTEAELIEDLLARSNWPDMAAVDVDGGLEAPIDFRKAHHLDGFPTPEGRFRFKADWRSQGADHAVMPVWPDHLANIDLPTPERPFRLVAAPARQFLNSSFSETVSSRTREGEPRALLAPLTMRQLGLAEGERVRIGNERGSLTLAAAAREGQQDNVIVVESVWPNSAFAEGVGINLLIGSDPAPPNGGAAIHDTAVWLEPALSGQPAMAAASLTAPQSRL